MQSTASVLLKKSILKPSGEISKDKINLVAGAITQPFAEMVWVTTGGDMETINRLTDVLVSMNTPADRGKLFKIIKLLYGLMGLPFSEEAEPMDADPDVLEYFIFSFMADFGEVMQELIGVGVSAAAIALHGALILHPALMLLVAPKASGIVLDQQVQALEQAAFMGKWL